MPGMNPRGIALAALVFVVTLVAASVVAPGTPSAFWSVLYAEAKSWAAALGPTLAIIVGAWIGFRGVIRAQRENAKLNRDRDDRLRRDEIRGLCRAFAAELIDSAKKLRATAGSVDEAIKNREYLKIENFRDHYNPVTDIYQANLDKIGLFGELARDVVEVYEHLAVARGDTKEAVKRFNDDGLLDPTGIDAELHWLAAAKKADSLARRLEAYNPPND